MRGEKRVRDEDMHNGEINDSKKIGQGGNMLMANRGHRETHPCLLFTALLHDGHGRGDSNDIYKEHEQNENHHIWRNMRDLTGGEGNH